MGERVSASITSWVSDGLRFKCHVMNAKLERALSGFLSSHLPGCAALVLP